MSLGPGTRIGSYEIVVPLGAGGMGEVYRARDTRLGREVAIKILPESFAQDPERVARFQREAQMLAALNHPHIGGIHGLEDVGGARFLVLELVEGETLDARLKASRSTPGMERGGFTAGTEREGFSRAGGLALDEALTIARQIVDALEAAHDKGIIHRDLKPANIMLTHDGQVKVLDFGLAKYDARSASLSGERGDMTHSPTLTFAATQAGVILGTAAYMSPEQAKGRAADKRSDVWAFGCVLFELLTGKRAFEGEDVSDTLAAILRGEPDWTALPADVPPHVRAIVRRCLAKDRKARIPDISVVRFMMDENAVASDFSRTSATTSPAEAGLHARKRPGLLFWQAATVLLLLTTLALPAAYLLRARTPAVTRFFVSAPEKTTFAILGRPAAVAAISPDGLKLAFTARDAAGKVLLWVRPIDSLTAQPLVGTDDAAYPFWSPDSRSIGYSTRAKLMKIAATGGPPQTLCAFSGASIIGRGGAWNRDGVIVFNKGPGPLFRVSSAGGQPSPVGRLAPGQGSHNFPSFLPDAHHVLYYGNASSEAVSGLYVVSLDTGESKRILGADTGGIYTPQGGYLLFVRQGTLLAQSFDPKTLALADEPFPIAERVESAAVPGVIAFSLSETGVLAYGIGGSDDVGFQMVWVDRQGKVTGTAGPPGPYRGLDLAPDGERVAAHRHDGQGGDIWVTELSRGTTSRFTFDASQENSSPIWSPDGTRIAFASLRGGKWGVYQKPANNAGSEERLFESDLLTVPMSWAPDGRSLVYEVIDPKTREDLWVLPLSGERKPIPLLHTLFRETHGQISFDGKWLAYMSTETGQNEVYVQPVSSGAGKWQISTGGGVAPRWRGDGRELFYMAGVKLMAVDVKSNGLAFEAGTPKELFDHGSSTAVHSGSYHNYAVTRDRQRFLISRRASRTTEEAGPPPIVVVVNWAEGLRK